VNVTMTRISSMTMSMLLDVIKSVIRTVIVPVIVTSTVFSILRMPVILTRYGAGN
jgi:hypothetical protein